MTDDSKAQIETLQLALSITEQQRNEQANVARNLAVTVAQLQKQIKELKPEKK